MHLARFGPICRIDDGALFHLRDFARNPDDDPRMDQHLAPVGLLNEVVEHALGYFEIRDDPVLHGTDSHNVARRTAEHVLRFSAYGLHFTGVLVTERMLNYFI